MPLILSQVEFVAVYFPVFSLLSLSSGLIAEGANSGAAQQVQAVHT